MAKEIKWERLTPTEAQTLAELNAAGIEVYAAPIEIEKKAKDRQAQFESLEITQADCKTWRIGSEKIIVHLTPAPKHIYDLMLNDLRAKHRDEYRSRRCQFPGKRKGTLIMCPECNRCRECPFPNYRDQHKARVVSRDEMLEKLCARYPDLLIEGCSGGGGRFDAGMLYYCPQIWCSDNTDAIDRLVIQHGSSFGYPAAAVGAHVSICPNHQTGRTVPLSTRGIVAAAGTFGYELDPAQLTKAECGEVRRQIRAYCEDAPLVRGGLYYRLSDPAKDAWCAWSFVSEDGSSALLGAVLREKHANAPAQYLRLRGLVPGARYRARETGKIYPADALTDAGLPLPLDCAEYGGFTLHLERE